MKRLRWRLAPIVATGLVWSCTTYSSLDLGPGGSLVSGGGQAGSGSDGRAGTSASQAGDASAAGAGNSPSGGDDNGGTATLAGGQGGAPQGGAPEMPSAGSSGAGAGSVVPTGVSLAADTQDLVHSVDTNGSGYSNRCPPGQLLIGFYGTVDNQDMNTSLRSEQGICGLPQVSKSAPWTVTVAQTAALPVHGVEFADRQTAKCPANEVVVGFSGRAGVWIDSIDLRCAPLKILGMSPSFLLVTSTPSTSGSIGGTQGGSTFDPSDCEAGSVAVGQVGNTSYSGDVLGTFGVLCTAASLDTGPG